MFVLTLDFFSCMPLLNLFNFDNGGCPVFSEKISFAEVIRCKRLEVADSIQLLCAIVFVFIYKVQLVFSKQLHAQQFSVVCSEDKLSAFRVRLLALEFSDDKLD